MANTKVSIRERIKTADGGWKWSRKIPIPESKLKPAEAQRKGNLNLVYIRTPGLGRVFISDLERGKMEPCLPWAIICHLKLFLLRV